MNRLATHLWLMSALGGIFMFLWLLFSLYPALDIAISKPFYDPAHPDRFPLMYDSLMRFIQKAVHWLAYLMIALPALLLLARRCWPQLRLGQEFTSAKAAYLWLALALGPGLVVHAGFKEFFERPRPVHSDVFGGEYAYVPPMVVGAQEGKSFVSGHAAMGFYFCAFALLAKARKRQMQLYAFGIFMGLFLGGCRVLQGRHFASDILFSGAVTLLCAHVAFLVVMSISRARRPLSTGA